MNNDIEPAKPAVSLVPPEALEEVAKVMGFGGEKKYSPFRFREQVPPRKWRGMWEAAERHMLDWLNHKKSDNDPETGLNHLAHASANLLMLLASQLSEHGEDDRYRVVSAPPPAGGVEVEFSGAGGFQRAEKTDTIRIGTISFRQGICQSNWDAEGGAFLYPATLGPWGYMSPEAWDSLRPVKGNVEHWTEVSYNNPYKTLWRTGPTWGNVPDKIFNAVVKELNRQRAENLQASTPVGVIS
jgi:hypothetical protein